MRPIESLRPELASLAGRDFGALQALRGTYTYREFQLHIDQVPKDPYAPPGTGVFRASVPRSRAGFPESLHASDEQRTAFCDFLARQFHTSSRNLCPGRRGTGNSGVIAIAQPGQEILDRSSIRVDEEKVEARFFVGLPASGRDIDSATATKMLFEEVPSIVEASLFASAVDLDALARHVRTYENAEHLRHRLDELGLVAFVADGSVLPRESGVDARPLLHGTVVRFRAPESLRISIDLPYGERVFGMGIPRGVTLIVGGGYHGKSTLLQALELGVYNHVPGDGRELCISVVETVKVRAASGRSVASTDISAFINNLPFGQETASFSAENASGSTSQAAFIAESIEAGAKLLLMDEDTCAANFMVRDGRMQELVTRDKEPITAFVDAIHQLEDDLGVSTVLVMGGSGDYFGVADHVIQMVDFEPLDVTRRAHEIAHRAATQRTREGKDHLLPPRKRAPDARLLSAKNEYGHFRITARDPHHLVFGESEIDLSDVEQLVETAQTRGIGRAIDYAKRYLAGNVSLNDGLQRVIDDIANEGLDLLDPSHIGDVASFRRLDLAAALNRVRGLKAVQL